MSHASDATKKLLQRIQTRDRKSRTTMKVSGRGMKRFAKPATRSKR